MNLYTIRRKKGVLVKMKNKFKFKSILFNNSKLESKNIKNNLRPKWDYSNRFDLYYNYFTVFSFANIHSLSYLSHYLEPIFKQTLYYQAYSDFYF